MASPIRANRVNYVGYRRSTNLDLVSGGVVTSSNTNRVFRCNSAGTHAGTYSSYRPNRTINGFTSMTRARAGTDESVAKGSGNVYLVNAITSYSIEEQTPIATVLEGSGSTPSESADDVTYIHVLEVNPATFKFDRIPNYALHSLTGTGSSFIGSVITSTANGNWADGSTWTGGVVPDAGDIVRVFHDVTYNSNATTKYYVVSVENGGSLTFSTGMNTQLWVQTLQVRETGSLTIGTSASPIPNGTTAKVVFIDRMIDTSFDPNQYGNGLIVLGAFTACGFDRGARFVRSSHERSAGATTITLASTPSSWQSGDSLYIPDTRGVAYSAITNLANWVANARWEYRTISSRSGAVVTLSSALTYDHPGPRDDAGTLDTSMLWHVFNLSSNVTVESESAAGTRGHCLFTSHARVDLRHVRFANLGRTTSDDLNNTTFDGSGVPTAIGTNQIGRYPVHFHHCGGREAISYDGDDYQFLVLGCVVDQGVSADTRKWGITVHGTHWGLVRNNLCHNTQGAGYVLEDGTETHNWLDGNAAVRMPGLGATEITDSSVTGFARNGCGYWMRSCISRFSGNVTANVWSFGVVVNAISMSNVSCPVYPGQHMHGGSLSGGATVDPYTMGVWDMQGFECYGYSSSGMTAWWLNSVDVVPVPAAPRSPLKGFRHWHLTVHDIYHYPSCNVTVDGWRCLYDPAHLATGDAPFSLGIYSGDYFQFNQTVKNCYISGCWTGIDVGSFNEGQQQILDNVVHAVYGVKVVAPGSPGSAPDGESQGPRVIYIEGNDLSNTSAAVSGYTPREVYRSDADHGGSANYVVQQEVYVTRGAAAYRLYANPEQRPGSTLPPNSGNQVGCPEAGLTNQQAHDKYVPYDPAVGAATPVKPDAPNPATPGLCRFNTLTPAGCTNPSWTNADVEAL